MDFYLITFGLECVVRSLLLQVSRVCGRKLLDESERGRWIGEGQIRYLKIEKRSKLGGICEAWNFGLVTNV